MIARRGLLASTLALLFFVAPSSASAGFNFKFNFPKSLHIGGAFSGLVGRGQDTSASSFAGEGTLEYVALDVLAVGLVVRSQPLPALPQPIGDRATTFRVRARLQLALVPSSAYRRLVVPYVSLGIDGGAGWVAGAPSDDATRAVVIGGQLRIGLMLAGRVSVYIPVGYERTILEGTNVRQFETGLGVLIRLAGRTDYGPRPPRTDPPAEEEESSEDEDRTADALRRLGDRAREHHDSREVDTEEDESSEDEEGTVDALRRLGDRAREHHSSSDVDTADENDDDDAE